MEVATNAGTYNVGQRDSAVAMCWERVAVVYTELYEGDRWRNPTGRYCECIRLYVLVVYVYIYSRCYDALLGV